MECDLLIIGGGAAGLAAACALSSWKGHIIIAERQNRVGKKLLATGNGRCNLSNTDMSPAFYHNSEAFVQTLYSDISPKTVMDYWSSLGLLTLCESGRIYPRTFSSSSVLDTLRQSLGTNTELLTDTFIEKITPTEYGYDAYFSQGVIRTRYCILAVGTNAGLSHISSTLSLIDTLSIPTLPLQPALVPLTGSNPFLKSLKGLRVRAKVSLLYNDCLIRENYGEVLFTDYGLSGVCIMELAQDVRLRMAEHKSLTLSINFLPEIDSAFPWLQARLASFSTLSLSKMMTGILPRLLAQAVIKSVSLSPDQQCGSLSSKECALLLQALTAFKIPITGTLGAERAQVMSGGISLESVSPTTMEINNYPGLFAIGEILDCIGPCGGYNLHFAVASALCAAQAIQKGKK